jgi:hypothetical protein
MGASNPPSDSTMRLCNALLAANLVAMFCLFNYLNYMQVTVWGRLFQISDPLPHPPHAEHTPPTNYHSRRPLNRSIHYSRPTPQASAGPRTLLGLIW